MAKGKGEEFENFFKKAVAGVTSVDAEEKTKKFFEIMSSEQVFQNLRSRFYELAERNEQKFVELSQEDVSFFMHYFNYMYMVYMGMIDTWRDPESGE